MIIPHSHSMRITALLQKIHQLASQAEKATPIDIDLMLDYTRVLYSDLLEWRDATPKPNMPAEPPAPKPAAPVTERPAPPMPPPAPVVQPAAPKPVAPVPAAPAEPTLEEYMASLRGQAIHREPDAPAGTLFAEETGASDRPAAAPIEAVPATPPPLPKVEAPVPVAKVEAPPPVTAAAPPPVRDIRSLIGINDKYQIMSELFGNDKAAYEQALDMINRAESEQAAFNWLRERLWVTEDHSDAAMIFFDVVRRFKNA